MTESMIDRVAREIALWVGYSGGLDTMPPGDPGDPRNEAWVEKNFRPFLPSAHFAIKAMREPTKEMLNEIEPALNRAYDGAKDGDGATGATSYKSVGGQVWQAMIDKALEDD